MGSEDAGDNELQPPPRNHEETDFAVQCLTNSIPTDLSQTQSENHPNCSEQQPTLVQMSRDGLRTTDCRIAVARIPGTTATDDKEVPIVDEHETNQQDVPSQETETNPEARELDQISVSKIINRNTPVVGLGLSLAQGHSNESFGGTSIGVNEHPAPQPHEGAFIHAHPVQEADSALIGPLVDARPIDDEDSRTKARNRRLRIMGTVACLVIVLVAGLVVGLGTGKESNSTNTSVSNNDTSVVETFVEMLPEFISPKSRDALSNPLSAQSQARSWIESLPIHNTMTIERLKQRYALATLYYSTGDQLWCNSDSWLTDSDECTWFSSSNEPICSDGMYISLDLKDNCLQNVQLDEIFLLSSLQSLTITSSATAIATGGFPDTLFRLRLLTALSLVSIGFNGTFPEGLKDLSNLELLDVSNNQLSGNLENVMSLTSLKVFDCSFNLLSGTIPTEIGQLTNLVEWNSSSYNFQTLTSRELSASMGSDALDRRDGVVISGIPSEVGNLSNLLRFDVSFSPIGGKIPSEVGRLVKLESLKMLFNQLSGTIPDEVFALTNLKHLDLLYNKLTGSLPSHVGRMVNLRYLGLELNSLGGPLPTEIGNLLSLRRLAVSYNQFNGTIPSTLGNLDQLLYLGLSVNRFVGSIPTEIGMLADLSDLYLDYNSITGTIPSEVGSLWNLSFATFDNTFLIDPIPSELGLLRNSLVLSMYNTAMVGPMPPEVCANVDLAVVNCNVFVSCACCVDLTTGLVCQTNATSTIVSISSASSVDGGSTLRNNESGL